MLFLLPVRCSEELDWAVDRCLGWYHWESRSGVVRDVPAYQRHTRELPKSSPVCRAGIALWTIKKSTVGLDRDRQGLVTRSQPVARESEWKYGEIASVRAPVPSRGAPTASEGDRTPLLLVESKNLLNS